MQAVALPVYRAGEVVGITLVDAADFALANRRWYSDHGYIMHQRHRRPRVYLHRVIAETPAGMETDHINGCKWDNRRANLRVVSKYENMQNRHPGGNRGSRSRYRGVSWQEREGRWRVRVDVHGKQYYLGHFADEDEAGAIAAAFRRDHMPDSLQEVA